jgi:NADH:ubiquinone oxidoreductase subunit 6 (subunit J)
MGIVDWARLLFWIALISWLIWFVSVQLDRLHKETFALAKAVVWQQCQQSAGFLRVFGLVLYSPYLWPVRSVMISLLMACGLWAIF